MDDSNSTNAGEIPDFYDHDNDSSYISGNNVSYSFTVFNIVNLVTLVIGLPVVSLALYVVYRQFKANHVANVYVINLLISDIIQFLGRPWMYFIPLTEGAYIFTISFISGIISSLGFMVCIAMERYLLIAHPHWYRSHFTLKLSAVISFVVWLVYLAVLLLQFLSPLGGIPLFFFTLRLIPSPFLLFFFVGTWRGLSKTITLSSREKKRILATLLLVIANYTFLFLPQIISYYQHPEFLIHWETIGLFFSPLVDPLLYIFIRKDAKHIMEEFPCCRRSSRNEEQTISSIVVSENTRSV